MRNRRIAIWLAMAALATSSLLWAAKHKKDSATEMSPRQRALHALNRFTFGPRPGEADRVAAMSVDK